MIQKPCPYEPIERSQFRYNHALHYDIIKYQVARESGPFAGPTTEGPKRMNDKCNRINCIIRRASTMAQLEETMHSE